MANQSNEDWIKTKDFIRAQTRTISENPSDEEIRGALKKGEKKVFRFMIVNIVIVLSFLYAIQSGITQLGREWIVILLVIFTANMGMFLYQKQQFKKAHAYLDEHEDEDLSS